MSLQLRLGLVFKLGLNVVRLTTYIATLVIFTLWDYLTATLASLALASCMLPESLEV